MKTLIVVIGLLFAYSGYSNPVSPSQLQNWEVTEGRLLPSKDSQFEINATQFRGTLKFNSKQHVTLRFKYLGPTLQTSYLTNGEVRHQLGIKLRAQDPCNLVYVMWNFDLGKIVVSVKTNSRLHSSSECKDNGYRFDMKPEFVSIPVSVNINEWHALTVELVNKRLVVVTDGSVVWRGDLIDDVLEFGGPVGIRSDNVHILFDYNVER